MQDFLLLNKYWYNHYKIVMISVYLNCYILLYNCVLKILNLNLSTIFYTM